MDAGRVREAGRSAPLMQHPPLPGPGCSLCSCQPQLSWLGEGGWQGKTREGTGALLASLNYTS